MVITMIPAMRIIMTMRTATAPTITMATITTIIPDIRTARRPTNSPARAAGSAA